MEPGVEPYSCAVCRVLAKPRVGCLFNQVYRGEHVRINLFTDLKRVTAIDEYRRPVRQHNGEPRRSSESSQPGKPLGSFGDEFALMFVGERNKKAVERVFCELLSERGNAFRWRGAHTQSKCPLSAQGFYRGNKFCRLGLIEQRGKDAVGAGNIGQECRRRNSFQQGIIYLCHQLIERYRARIGPDPYVSVMILRGQCDWEYPV